MKRFLSLFFAVLPRAMSLRALAGSIIAATLIIGCLMGSTPAVDSCAPSCGSASDTCMADSTVTGCTGTASGYSCTGSTPPNASDPTLSCSVGVAGTDETLYCCADVNATGACMADSTVTGCTGTTSGYSCTGSTPPNVSDPTLSCSVGVAGTGETLYCCADVNATGTCMADSTVTGCTGTASGYSCTGSTPPNVSDPTLSCSVGAAGTGETLYCCSGVNVPGACMADPTVTGCTGSAYGFSCTGTAPPNANDPSLSCSAGVADTGDTSYCCSVVDLPATCMPDATVTGCTGGAYGFTCTDSSLPNENDPSLSCSAGVAGSSGDTSYCCLTN
jgi:hypothetical protein